jgi:hypothetical protein
VGHGAAYERAVRSGAACGMQPLLLGV